MHTNELLMTGFTVCQQQIWFGTWRCCLSKVYCNLLKQSSVSC